MRWRDGGYLNLRGARGAKAVPMLYGGDDRVWIFPHR
jgi:hypothetical protein